MACLVGEIKALLAKIQHGDIGCPPHCQMPPHIGFSKCLCGVSGDRTENIFLIHAQMAGHTHTHGHAIAATTGESAESRDIGADDIGHNALRNGLPQNGKIGVNVAGKAHVKDHTPCLGLPHGLKAILSGVMFAAVKGVGQ